MARDHNLAPSKEELAALQWLANLQSEKEAQEFLTQRPEFAASFFEGYNDRPLILTLQRGRPFSEVEQIRLPTPAEMERSKSAWVLAVSEDIRLIWRNDPRHAERLLTDYLFYGRRMTPDPEETKQLEEERRAWEREWNDLDKPELPWVETEEECREREKGEKERHPWPDEIILHEAAKDVRELPVRPNWRRRGFVYVPRTPFQRALYWLLCNSQRAKICANPDCPAPHFIAKKSIQMYCGDDCADLAVRKAKLDWWNREGKFQRQQKTKAAKRAKKSKGGRR